MYTESRSNSSSFLVQNISFASKSKIFSQHLLLDFDVGVLSMKLHACIGAAVGALGPELFLKILPLNLDVENTSEANVFLLPILKQYTVGERLSFFKRSILILIRRLRQKSQKVLSNLISGSVNIFFALLIFFYGRVEMSV